MRDAALRQASLGRKRLVDKDPDLLLNLDDLVEPDARGDPMCPLRPTSKSTGHIADALQAMGHEVSADTVGGFWWRWSSPCRPPPSSSKAPSTPTVTPSSFT